MLSQENSVLLVVDIQGKLANLMHEHELVYRNISRLIKTCEILHVPILWTEQAPDKIGSTIPVIHDLLFPIIKPITIITHAIILISLILYTFKPINI